MTPEAYIISARAHIKHLTLMLELDRADSRYMQYALSAICDLDDALLEMHSMTRVRDIPLQIHEASFWKRITERLKDFRRHAA